MLTRRKRIDTISLLNGCVDVKAKQSRTATLSARSSGQPESTLAEPTHAAAAAGPYYDIEEVIATKKKHGQPRSYLVSWKGYPPNMTHWVPEKDVSELVTREFYDHVPSDDNIRSNISRLKHQIDIKLNSRIHRNDKYIRLNFDHAVYRTLFGDKTQLHKRDFSHEFFEQGWDESIVRDVGPSGTTVYSGSEVVYPIVTKLYLSTSTKGRFCKNTDGTYTEKKLVYVEMLSMFVDILDY